MINRNNPVLFACGVPRSGTTLLQRMLNSHPDLAIANDSHFIPRALEKTDHKLVADVLAGERIPLTNTLIANVIEYHRFYRLGLSQQRIKAVIGRCEYYDELVSNIYSEFANANGKFLAGEKTPDYCRRLDLLHALFPQAKLIHIVRDGRNVALSLLQWAAPDKGPGRIELWQTHPVGVCALWWRWLALAGMDAGQRLGDSYHQLQYESLVAQSETVLAQLCRFLDIDYSPQMLKYNSGKQRSAGSAKSAWRSPVSGLRNWKRDMPESDVQLFEALAGDALQAFGYELQYADHDAATSNTADFCRQWWNDHFKEDRSVLKQVKSLQDGKTRNPVLES